MTSAFPNGDRPRGETSRRNPLIPDAIAIPPEALARHRARVLDPATAVRPNSGERPYSTVYRADTMLVPAGDVQGLLPNPDESNDVNRHLAEIGLELRPSREEGWQGNVGRLPADLGVPVPLVRKDTSSADRAPDPWAALVWLRDRLTDRVKSYSLDHLVMSASVAVEGAPVSNGGAVGGVPVSNGGSVGGAIALYTGSRNPVAMLMPQPVRPDAKALVGGRRPVVAVLDTGIGPHPWWGDLENPGTDPIVEVSQDFQDLLAQQEVNDPNMAEPYPLDTPWEERNLVQPLLGLLDSHAGHGTFVAGLVHQLCPAAKILSLRVLHSDGYSTEGALLLALNHLAERVESGDPALMVDVVSLSLGFYPETTQPAQVAQVLNAIDRLTAKGVLVVAAAGNDATTRPFLPAAFGRGTGDAASGLELLSAIGARNAPGLTTAAFSNWGEWISRWAPGNALVSTVPVWEGAAGAGLTYPDPLGLGPWLRTAPDPDDLRSGFAVWAGTSFATPVVAGLLAGALATDEQSASATDGPSRAQRALIATDAELVRRHWQ
ncbi:S8 family serine peptidase [Actinophytocola sp. NPDC049390]|uniref:S8 family serine peptidase n=1 Tax=Actinophytocola sp. NPDC049390 TaxID=3363894 RepID=UPI00378A5EBD